MKKALVKFWQAFTYTDGRFSRSGFLRTLFSLQLLWAFSWSVHVHVPQHGITWEMILLAAICGAYFLSDYKVLRYLTDMKKGDTTSYGGFWRRGGDTRPAASQRTEDLE